MAIEKQNAFLGVSLGDDRKGPEGLIAAIMFMVFVGFGRLVRLNPKASMILALVSIPITIGVWFFDLDGSTGIGLLYFFAAFPMLIGMLPWAAGFFAIFGIAGMVIFDHHLPWVVTASGVIAIWEIVRGNTNNFARYSHGAVSISLLILPTLYFGAPVTSVISAETYCAITPNPSCESFRSVTAKKQREQSNTEVPRLINAFHGKVKSCLSDNGGQQCSSLFELVTKEHPESRVAFAFELCSLGSMWGCLLAVDEGDTGQSYQSASRLWDKCDLEHQIACDAVTAYKSKALVKDRTERAWSDALEASQRGCKFGAEISCKTVAALQEKDRFVSQ